MVGSGKFDRIRIGEKGPDPTGSGSATLQVPAPPLISGLRVFHYWWPPLLQQNQMLSLKFVLKFPHYRSTGSDTNKTYLGRKPTFNL